MEVKITQAAVEALKPKLEEKGENYAVRVYVTGIG